MCMSCGCKQPNEDHGDKRHITMSDLEAAAQANETQVDDVVQNIYDTFQEAGGRQAVSAGRTGQVESQDTGANAQRFEDRQGGYGSGSSNSPQ